MAFPSELCPALLDEGRGDLIKGLREEQGCTRRQLATRAWVNRTTLRRIEGPGWEKHGPCSEASGVDQVQPEQGCALFRLAVALVPSRMVTLAGS